VTNWAVVYYGQRVLNLNLKKIFELMEYSDLVIRFNPSMKLLFDHNL